MQDLGPDAFPRHLSGLLFDDARAHHWVTAVHDGARARALSPSDALTLGVLLARCSTTGRGETARAAEAALGRSVARRTLRSNVVRDAARLAEEVAVASSAGRGEGAADTHPWLHDAVPALSAVLLRAGPGVGARRGERLAAAAPRRGGATPTRRALLETLVRAARARGRAPRGDGVDEDDELLGLRLGGRARVQRGASAVPSTTPRRRACGACLWTPRPRARRARLRQRALDAADVRGRARACARLEIERAATR